MGVSPGFDAALRARRSWVRKLDDPTGPDPTSAETVMGAADACRPRGALYFVNVTILPTLAFGNIGDLLCLCYLRQQGPADADWNAWLERLRARDFNALLVSSLCEGKPDSKQRRLVAEYWKSSGRSPPRVARLTASPITRGAFTALSWLLPNLPMRAFASKEVAEALAWLGSPARPAEVSALLVELAMGHSSGEPQRRAG